MDKIVFTPWIDLPVAGLIAVGFVLHFNAWARNNTAQTNVDLRARLPTAKIRVLALLAVIVLGCWISNFPVWGLFAICLAVGFGFAILTGHDGSGSGFLLVFAAYIIREWAFGFPQLILHPPSSIQRSADPSRETNELVGAHGIVLSPLRPCGVAQFGEREISVVSERGTFIDTGSTVVVSKSHNGQVCVRPIEAAREPSARVDFDEPSSCDCVSTKVGRADEKHLHND
jgi:hypothetical protein